jgi:hypothetical protein
VDGARARREAQVQEQASERLVRRARRARRGRATGSRAGGVGEDRVYPTSRASGRREQRRREQVRGPSVWADGCPVRSVSVTSYKHSI